MITLVIILLAGLLTLLAIGLLIGAIMYRTSVDRTWRRLAVDQYRCYHRLASEPSVVPPQHVLDEYWGFESAPSLEVLMLRLAQIETEANKVLDASLGPQRRQLFEIRSELRRLGLWSDKDVATFDRAMMIRNSMVHGGDHLSSEPDGVTSKDLSPLLAKLHLSFPPVASSGPDL